MVSYLTHNKKTKQIICNAFVKNKRKTLLFSIKISIFVIVIAILYIYNSKNSPAFILTNFWLCSNFLVYCFNIGPDRLAGH